MWALFPFDVQATDPGIGVEAGAGVLVDAGILDGGLNADGVLVGIGAEAAPTPPPPPPRTRIRLVLDNGMLWRPMAAETKGVIGRKS